MIAKLVIQRGIQFEKVVQWMTDPLIYKDVAGVVNASPLQLQVPGHGLPVDWLIAVPGVTNKVASDPFVRARIISGDVIEVPGLSIQSAPQYAAPTQIYFKTPLDISGADALLQARGSTDINAPVLLEMSVANGRIAVDAANSRFSLGLTSNETQAITFVDAFYRLTLTLAGGHSRLISGRIAVKS